MNKYVVSAVIIAALSTGCGKNHYEYVVGAPGATGAQGPQGDPGADGTPGINGSSVTVVKLCPGTTTYPTKFVEVAFCINNKLYGTYSANDGFSTELPPGTYGSNGINASCNFTVLANCCIQN